MEIKVVGKGCDHYFELINIIKELMERSKKSIDLEEVFNNKKINDLGVTSLPALVVDGKIFCQGVSYDKNEIIKIF